MRGLALIISTGLLAACGETATTPGNDTATAVNASPPVEAAGNVATDAVAVNATEAAATAASAAEKPASIASLPLKRGFYVASDTSCGQASNATLSLFVGDGFNGSRDSCGFRKIEKIGATSYRVTEECSSGGEAWGSEEQKDTSIATYEIAANTIYKRKMDGGWESSARYCAQSSLPEPWRDNDISEFIK